MTYLLQNEVAVDRCNVNGTSLGVRIEPDMAARLSTRLALLLLVVTLLVQPTTGADVLPPHDCVLSHGAEGPKATCRDVSNIPETLHNRLRILKLINTTLTVLENGTLSHLPGLAVLDLSRNRLTRLELGAFRGLPHLKHLNLAHNQLCFGDDAFPAGVFLGVTSLRALIMHSNDCPAGHDHYPDRALGELSGLETLAMNGLPNVPLGPGFANMKSLKSLELSGKHCNMDVVSNETFVSLTHISVSQLSLRACEISKINGNAFTPLPSLTSLNLACNERIGMDDATFAIKESNMSLHTVILDDISSTSMIVQKRMFASQRFQTVRRLSVRANDIIAVDVRAIHSLPAVRRVAAGYNSIYSQNAFFPREDSLEILHNATANSPLEVIDASHLLSTRLEYRRLFCEPDHVDFDDFFREKPSLPGVLYTRPYRPTGHTKKPTSMIPPSLQVVFVDNSSFNSYHYSLPKIRITDYSDMVVFNLSNTDMNVLKGPLVGFLNLQVFDASNCHIYQICSGALRELSRLKYLFLQRNVIGERGHGIDDQFHGLYSLLELDLSDNKIPSIGRDAFRGLTQMRKLNLRGNRLAVLGFDVSRIPRVVSVDVSHNLVVYGDSSFVQSVAVLGNNTKMDLTNNVFVCNCSSAAFARWVQATSVNLVGKADLQCVNDSGHVVEIAAIDQRHVPTPCPVVTASHGGHYIGIIIGCLFFTVVVVLVIAVGIWCSLRRRVGNSKVAYRLFDGNIAM